MYHRILVPLDGSATAERGLREAIGLAAEQKARLSLLHVADNFPMLVEMSSVTSSQEMLNDLRRYGEDVLAKAKRAAADAGVQADTLLREVTQGRIADVIIDETKKTGCGLIVMGTHGRRGFSRLTLGSEAERVVRSSTVPVLLVRLDEPKS
ncbi:universal stress protein [Polaromonas sp. P1(28)-8]|nr:universal stress protein [Polaromonas sp. P1(28)-8]